MINRELEHVLRLRKKSVLQLHQHFSAVLVFACPEEAHAYRISLLIIYPLHFEESFIKLQKQYSFSSTAVFICLPKLLLFCRQWGGRTGINEDSPTTGRVVIKERSSNFTLPHRRFRLWVTSRQSRIRLQLLVSIMSLENMLGSKLVQWCTDSICYSLGKVRLIWMGKPRGRTPSFAFFSF